ncbi:hypothetical protein Q3G72_018065 [Acer saccharum]|nr:hypothetical protein Q3G72_018065 [Acer saccharum]
MVTDRVMEDEFPKTSTLRNNCVEEKLSICNLEISLHLMEEMTLPERVTEIVEPSLLLEVGAGINNNVENYASRQGEGSGRIEECCAENSVMMTC